MKLAVALAFLGLNLYIFQFLASEEVIPERELFASFPLSVGDWRCQRPEQMLPTSGLSTNLVS